MTGFSVEANVLPVVSHAMAHNGIGIVSDVIINPAHDVPAATLSILVVDDESPLSRPFTTTVDLVAGQPTRVAVPGVELDAAVMSQIAERRRGQVILEVRAGSEVLASHSYAVDVLAAQQWLAEPPGLSYELLASYVMPNAPEIVTLMQAVANRLATNTGSSAIEGYQAGAERVDQIVAAIYEEMAAFGIGYAEPPASWADVGQKVRTPREVLEGRLATCLDTCVVMAAALEQAGIRPLIWVIEGHSFLGYWRAEVPTAVAANSEVSSFRNLIDLDVIGVIETTSLTRGGSLAQARAAALEHTTTGTDLCVLDVWAARRARIYPLPAVRRIADGSVQVFEYRPAAHLAAPRSASSSTTAAPSPIPLAPPRIEQWKNNLLDLSLRNRLINFTPRAGLELLLTPEVLDQIEDDLYDQRQITLWPNDAFDMIQAARSTDEVTAADLPAEIRSQLYQDRRSVYVEVGSADYPRQLQGLAYRARTIIEESGANNLYLALGSLVWNVDGRPLRSPVILVPVNLVRRGKATGNYRLTIDESGGATPNFCLLEKLRVEYGLQVPGLAEPASDGSGIDVGAALADLRRAVAEAGLAFHVEPTAHLAILMFGRFRLWKDLDQDWSKLINQPLVRHLVETPTQQFADPAAGGRLMHLDELSAGCPIPADGSQLAAIAAALSGRSLVIEGPPGTGKSQTIANLLARCIAEGKRVLFVAEKRAALSVVQERVRAVGLGAFALDLHDKGSKPAAVRAQLQTALDLAPAGDESELVAAQQVVEAAAGQLIRYRDRVHGPNAANLSLYSAAIEQLRLGPDGPSLTIPDGFVARVQPTALEQIRQVLRQLGQWADLAYPAFDAPWLFVGADDPDKIDRSAVLATATHIQTGIAALDGSGPLAECLRRAPSTAALRAIASLVNGPRVPREALSWASTPAWVNDLQQLLSQIADAQHNAARLQARPTVVELPLSQLRQDARAAADSSWFGRKKRLRAVAERLAPGMDIEPPIDREALPRLLDELAGLAGQIDSIRALLGRLQLIILAPDWNPLLPGAEEPVLAQAERCRLLHAELVSAAGPFEQAVDRLWHHDVDLANARATEELAAVVTELFRLTGTNDQLATDWAAGQGLLGRWLATAPGRDLGPIGDMALLRWLEFRAALRPLERAGLGDASWQLLTGQVSADDALTAFNRGVAATSLTERRVGAGLARFDADAHDRVVDRYAKTAGQVRELLRQNLAVDAVAGRDFESASTAGRVGELRRIIARQRGGLTVREMMSRYGSLITQLMPCVLVSPDSLARFIPVGALQFDLVVFDEASQIKVADAIGAIGRAKSAVVVGDSKQMPPTSFMEANASTDLDFDTEDAELGLVADEESILGECVQAGLERHWLSWHYRSLDESLIAFSNEHYYEGRLSSFPAPGRGNHDPGPDGHGIHLVRVDGQFHRSGDRKLRRTNPVEAQAVVDEITRRFDAAPAGQIPSIGVVTFNQPQRTLIESMLRSSADERLALALEQGGGDGLFVKNLENVQGDERDVILFSVAFSKNERGALPLNFGPLNLSGGERRLNVAITRARRQVVLFCSFDPAELRAHETSSIGVKHLKTYLEVAAGAANHQPVTSNRLAIADLHRDAIAERLRERGLSVETDVGLSDFRVDLVVGAPGQAPVMAVLLDGPQWAKRTTVGDRDATPPLVLGSMLGWPRVHRVWLPAWLADPEQVIARIEELVRDAPAPVTHSTFVELVDPEMTDETPTGSDGPTRIAAAPTATAQAPSAMLTESRPQFAAWRPAVTAAVDVLDNLGFSERARQQVSVVLAEVLAVEGPVQQGRLAKLVAGAFGLSRVSASRSSSILGLLNRGPDPDGFYWPPDRDPLSWHEFRPDTKQTRQIDEIHPIEIANAMAELCRVSGGLQSDELLIQAAQVFGFKRRTDRVLTVLNRAVELGLQLKRLRLVGDHYRQVD